MTANSPKIQSLLPGIFIVSLQWLLWALLPAVLPDVFILSVAGGTLLGLVFLIWWMIFSRTAPGLRWGGLGLAVLFSALALLLLHGSIRTGNMGLMYYMHLLPNICLALMAGALITRILERGLRMVVFALIITLAPASLLLLKSEGLDGEGRAMLAWRWAMSSEEKLLSSGESWEEASGSAQLGMEAEWPGFRGRERNGSVPAPSLVTDWGKRKPELLWKQPVGPGCSSFAISGSHVYTQEQRGEMELVSCYDLESGGLIWKHGDSARFYDSHVGAGPRATPTVDGKRVYSLGGTGILNVLDAESGQLLWSRNAAEELGVEALTWGFCASPLVVDSLLITAVSGTLAAYHKDHSELLWKMELGNSYSSPQLFTLNGVPQVLFMSSKGCSSLDPSSGDLLWKHAWGESDRILQPAITAEGKLLLTNELNGLRCLELSKLKADGTREGVWEAKTLWTNEELKMNFNDLLVHKGHAYVIDGPYLACVELKTGERLWRGKRYRGWSLLVPDQDLILILSERGELALVSADPDQFEELGSIKVLDDRVWNHMAMTGNVVLVRNSKEMAAFSLPAV